MFARILTNVVAARAWPKLGPRGVRHKHVTSKEEAKTNSSHFHSYRQIKTNCAHNLSTSNKTIEANGEPTIGGETNVELDDLELNLDNGTKMAFNLTWLRDSCHCQLCTHQFSRQRLFTAKDFRRHLFAIKEVKIHTDYELKRLNPSQLCWPKVGKESDKVPCLEILWADNHVSLYPMNWLENISSLYAGRQLNWAAENANDATFPIPQDDFYSATSQKTFNQVLWNVEKLTQCMRPVDYNDLTDGFDFAQFNEPTFINANRIGELSARRLSAMWSLSQQLVTYGLAKIVNVPQARGQVLNVARSLAYERPTGYGTVFDVVVEASEEKNLAYSALEFDLHSDLAYRETSPGVQMLHCIRDSSVGGESYFSDAFNAAKELQQLDSRLFKVLVRFPVTFVVRDPYRDIKFRRQQPILSLDFQANIKQVHYGPYVLPPVGHKDDVKLFYLALDKYTQLLRAKSNKLVTKMEPGDLFIFHNRRVLHGRASYDPASSNRFLQGCYMDWDEIECLHEKLHSSCCR